MSIIDRLALVAAMLLMCTWASAEPTLNPRNYSSPSTLYRLFVDPSSPEGEGSAAYRLTSAGQTIWARALPFSLWNAVVADDGTVAGYGYSHGRLGRAARGEESTLIVAIIDRDGEIRARHDHQRIHPNFRSNPPSPLDPVGAGLILDQTNDRVIVRAERVSMGGNQLNPWWIYRLSDGKKIVTLEPERPAGEHGFASEITAELIPGTPLILAHWYFFQRDGGDAYFALLDEAGQEIWNLRLNGEYAEMPDGWRWGDLRQSDSAQMQVGRESFEIASHAQSKRTRYTVSQDPGDPERWNITPNDEQPWTMADQSEAEPEIKRVELPILGEIVLSTPQAGEPQTEIRRVRDFGIDTEGRLGYIRQGDGDDPSIFLLLTTDGDIVSSVELSDEVGGGGRLPLPQPDGRWIILSTGLGEDPASAHILTPETGEVRNLELPHGGLRAAAPILHDPAGGFVANVGRKWLDTDRIARFDASGKQLWEIRASGRYQDLTVTNSGEVVTLTGVRNILTWYDLDGTLLRTASIADIIGGRPNYPSGLEADLEGGIILHDFNGSPPIYRFSAENELTAEFRPQWADGRLFRLYSNVKVAPDGSLWTADGHRFLRLDHEGQVQHWLGDDPASGTVSEIRALTVNRRGWIFAIDDASSAVHIFDHTGDHQRTFMPEPDDFSTNAGLGHITVAHDGAFYYYPQREFGAFGRGTRFLHVDADGSRVGRLNPTFDSIREDWLCKPNEPHIWAIGYREVRLLDQDRNTLRTITRRPDNTWLGTTDQAAVAPDGSLALLVRPRGMNPGPQALCIYRPNGAPRSTHTLREVRFARLAFDGRNAFIITGNTLRILDTDTDEVAQFMLPGNDERAYWFPHMGPGGEELWLYEHGTKRLLRLGLQPL